MKLGTKSILATTIATALFSTVATAAPATGPYVEIQGAADYPSWEVSSEKLQALSGDYTFQDTGAALENSAALLYKTDIDLNDGDKLTFDFGTSALVKGADYELVAANALTGVTYSIGDVVGVRISVVDTTNGVATVKLRIANAGATGIPAGTILALVEAGTTGTGTNLGQLTITAPTGTWSSPACVAVTATDVVGDSLPGATVGSTCILEFTNQYGLDAASLTDLTAKIDVAADRKTYVEQTTTPTADGDEALADATTATLTPASYIIADNSGSLDDFITLDGDDEVTYTFVDTSDWNGVPVVATGATAGDTTTTTFAGSTLDNHPTDASKKTYTETGAFATSPVLSYDVAGTTGTATLTPHVVSASAKISFDDAGANAGLSDVSISGADLYNVGINGSTSKVASFILNPSTAGFFSWVEIANESADTAEVTVDVVMNGMTYTNINLDAVAAETVATYGEAAIVSAIESQKGITVDANSKATLTFVVTAKEDKVQVSGQTKESGNGRTTLEVYYQDSGLDRKWRN